MAVNQYGGMMSLISIRDSFRPVRANQRIRVLGVTIMFVLVWSAAQFVGVERFNAFYGNVLIFLAYLFTRGPRSTWWTTSSCAAGLYVIREIFVRDGLYGRWGWRGNLAYVVTLAAMVPFMVTDALHRLRRSRVRRRRLLAVSWACRSQGCCTTCCVAAWTWQPNGAWSRRKAWCRCWRRPRDATLCPATRRRPRRPTSPLRCAAGDPSSMKRTGDGRSYAPGASGASRTLARFASRSEFP